MYSCAVLAEPSKFSSSQDSQVPCGHTVFASASSSPARIPCSTVFCSVPANARCSSLMRFASVSRFFSTSATHPPQIVEGPRRCARPITLYYLVDFLRRLQHDLDAEGRKRTPGPCQLV